MKKYKEIILCVSLMMILFISISYGDDGGEMGYSGGISEGTNLPYTMDKYVDSKIKKQTVFDYREIVFLSGVPIECKGTITIVKGEVDYIKEPSGTYKETYTIKASDTAGTANISRTLNFTTSYRVKEGEFKRQIIRNSQLTKWTETIVTPEGTYALIETASTYSKSSIEDLTPGVSYYDTVISYNAHYSIDEKEVISMVNGNIYGYSQPWSKVEAQKLKMEISRDGGATFDTVIELKPFLEAKKTLYYDETDPFPISFGGTFNQRLERESTLSYNILSSSKVLTSKQKNGNILISPANDLEKLPIPENLDFIAGHWAEEDVKKMYSMEIFTDTPNNGMQYQAMHRGAFVKALCLSMDISTEKYDKVTKTSPQIFADVPTTHPLYKYIMAAYDVKLIKGIGTKFGVDVPITRQEAFTIYVRVIGLERLGITNSPQTPFLDDNKIASWAKKEIMAGFKLGIIKGDNGYVKPTQWISKAEAAAIINRLVDYLREEISVDYRKN
ncbi:MAG: hypothetical protein CVU84_07880 [Firmicutes bacterium HGW-Firmicutes-1]|jgi:hypothetical protein|nr:MAG: hypothetical protein CVU84_07880 [Firmicutes bacterium HGW-Firmicutes-1]